MILREYSPPRRGGVAIERSALVKGNVYELSRKYGKPSCACAEGQLHRSMVLSWSDQGKTRLMTIPPEKLDRLRTNSEGAIRNGLLPCDHQQKDPGKTGGDRPLTFEETRRPAVGLYRQQYLHAFSWSPPVPRLSLYYIVRDIILCALAGWFRPLGRRWAQGGAPGYRRHHKSVYLPCPFLHHLH